MPNVRPLAVHAAAILAALFHATSASAQTPAALPTMITASPKAPVSMSSCKVTPNFGLYGDPVGVVVHNQTTHALLSVSVQIRFLDQDRTLVGQAAPTRTLETPLASGDDAAVQFQADPQLSEPRTAVVRAVCRVQSATFTGGKKWTYGQTWREKLLPFPAATNAPEGGVR